MILIVLVKLLFRINCQTAVIGNEIRKWMCLPAVKPLCENTTSEFKSAVAFLK